MTHYNKIIITGDLRSSKNSRRLVYIKGKPRFNKSHVSQRQFEEICWELKAQRSKWKEMISGRTVPLRVCFKMYRSTRQPFDYTNIIQNLCDAMVRMEYLTDDSANYLLPVFEPYEVDKDNPRTEVWIG